MWKTKLLIGVVHKQFGLGPEICSDVFLIVPLKANGMVSIIVAEFTVIIAILSALFGAATHFLGR